MTFKDNYEKGPFSPYINYPPVVKYQRIRKAQRSLHPVNQTLISALSSSLSRITAFASSTYRGVEGVVGPNPFSTAFQVIWRFQSMFLTNRCFGTHDPGLLRSMLQLDGQLLDEFSIEVWIAVLRELIEDEPVTKLRL